MTSSTGLPGFRLEVFQNEYLPDGGNEMHAVVTVTASGAATPAGPAAQGGAGAAVVVLVDTSGSMDFPATKIASARAATKAAIDTLRDGTLFAVVAGTGMATMVYPRGESLAVAGEATRAEARAAADKLRPRGGTAIGQWLLMAKRLMDPYPGLIRHAILLTDGKDESETRQDLHAAIDACAGVFTCDCRGVGTEWKVEELREVASGLLGTLDIVAKPQDLVADFTAMMEAAMGKAVADVALRLRTPRSARVVFVKQVRPSIEDLSARRTESGPNQGDYPTGSWGSESRDYHVCFDVAAGDPGDDDPTRVALVSLVAPDGQGGGTDLAKGGVFARWTYDEELSAAISQEVAFYTGRAELANAIQDGLKARRDNNEAEATAKLGRAYDMARESGDEATAKLLNKVIEVEPVTGTVRLRPKVADEDEMTLDTESTKTSQLRGR